ncbi:MAG: hypothetical protein IJ007_08970 [Oscillospiraceae bacterium]|nr:hypothetical protein [Oscillospiraceae bacterium]
MLFTDREITEFLNGYRYYYRYTFDRIPDFYRKGFLMAEVSSKVSEMLDECHSPEGAERLMRYHFYSGVPYQNGDGAGSFDFALLKNECGPEQNYINILIAGSMHPNGRCRQNCVRLLGEYPETLPYIILRMNDWVSHVSQEANSAALKAAKQCNVITAAKALLSLSRFKFKGRYSRQAYDELTEILHSRIMKHCTRKYLSSLPQFFSAKEKKQLYSILIGNRLISQEEAVYLMEHDADKLSQTYILLKLIAAYDFTEEQLIEFTRHKTPLVRLDALRKLTDKGCFPREEIERLLMDRCTPVREAAAYACRRYCGTDLREFYLSRFPKPEAVLAFAAMSTAEDETHFLPLLDSDRPKVRAAAINALCYIKGEFYGEIFYSELLKNDGCASKAAFKALNSCGAQLSPKRLYDDILRTDSDVLSRRLTSLLCSPTSPVWERMPYLLRLYNSPENRYWDGNKRCWQSNITAAVAKRNIYTRISPDTAEAVRLAMKECHLPEKLVWELEKDLENLT